MSTLFSTIPLFFVVVIILAAIGMFLQNRFLCFLRVRHVEIWKELGCPTNIANNSIKASLAVLSFLRKSKFSNIGDVELKRKASFLWTFFLIYMVIFGFFVVLLLVAILRRP